MHYRCSLAASFFLLLLYKIAIGAQATEFNVTSRVVESPQKPKDDDIVSRIYGGTEATMENVKHQVSIRSKFLENYHGFGVGHLCGGSLIGPDIVLTAAHCFNFDEPDQLIVVMGSLDRLDKIKNFSFHIKGVTIHPGYDKNNLLNDIAVAYLHGSTPSDSENIKPIQINRTPMEKGTICKVTGWGLMQNSTDDLQMARMLLTVDVALIPKCENTLINRAEISAGMICAGDIQKGGKGSCNGDSGGPLVCNGLLTGIVSWGVSKACELPYFPTVYTKVDYYQDWIDEQMLWKPKPKHDSVKNLSPIVAIIVLGIGATLV